ncbi:oleosin-B3-like [Dendrobium catenatum]|uniref:oleosin-B3-like n=1 Tax=Dendrobium catenatum TaxID=906689 RepID=UPI0010A004E1|nr:oleosin-B3-like [Dendrobium catenatum]
MSGGGQSLFVRWKSSDYRRTDCGLTTVELESGCGRPLGGSRRWSTDEQWSNDGLAEVRRRSTVGSKFGVGWHPSGGLTKVGMMSSDGRRPGDGPASVGGRWPGGVVGRGKVGRQSAAGWWSNEGQVEGRRQSAAGRRSDIVRRPGGGLTKVGRRSGGGLLPGGGRSGGGRWHEGGQRSGSGRRPGDGLAAVDG